ncbi:MAG: hypothetical protein IJX06_04855 [Clostridia bacterium]|nr:hypothetical protein [Clostridia bacterium]
MEKKKRKNRKPLIVVAMLLMVALVVGMGAMTYSRYVSSFNLPSQQATAAQWGYVVTANVDDFMGKKYAMDGGAATVTTADTGLVVNAKTGATKNIVAPGTKGSMSIVINGVAEVLAKFTIKATVNGNKQIKLGTYMPVKWTLKEDGAVLSTDYDLATVLNGTNGAKNLAPGTTLTDKTFTLEWEWVLGDNDTVNNQDTVIGMKSAGVTWANAQNAILSGGKKVTDVVADSDAYDAIVTELDFSLTVTLEQVQA